MGTFIMNENDIPGKQRLPDPSRVPADGGPVLPLLCLLLGETIAYACARLSIGVPRHVGHAIDRGQLVAILVILTAPAVGQILGAIVWVISSRARTSVLTGVVGGLLAGLASAIIIGAWRAIDSIDSIHLAEALLGVACCGVPGTATGSALGAIGAIVSNSLIK